MRTLSDDRKVYIDEMLAASTVALVLNDVTVQSDLNTRFGSVITPDGTIYALKKYGIHGVVAAILFPEQAALFGLPQPTGDLEFIPKMAYQEFDLACGKNLPLIRISCGLGLTISHGIGQYFPNETQIEALRHYLSKNDLLDSETVTEYNVASARKILQSLRKGEDN